MHSVFKLQHPLTFIANDPLPPPRPIYGAPHQRPTPQCADTATADNPRYKVRWRNDSRHDEPAKPVFVSTAAGATTSVSSAGTVLGKRKADASHEPPLPQLASTLPCTEFQSRADMYTELSGRVREFYQSCNNNAVSPSARPRYVDFHGSYSVVVDHGASHPKLVSLVSQDLQKIVKLPHRTDYSQKNRDRTKHVSKLCTADIDDLGPRDLPIVLANTLPNDFLLLGGEKIGQTDQPVELDSTSGQKQGGIELSARCAAYTDAFCAHGLRAAVWGCGAHRRNTRQFTSVLPGSESRRRGFACRYALLTRKNGTNDCAFLWSRSICSLEALEHRWFTKSCRRRCCERLLGVTTRQTAQGADER